MTEARIQFEQVTLPATDRYDVAVTGISFVLQAGEGLVIEVEDERECPPLADVAEGLLEPEAGVVRVDGSPWPGLSGDAAVRVRSRIGRVFETQAWLSNLDVDENVTLAQRHHTTRPEADIRDEALALMRRFGRDAMPPGRPAWAPRHELIVAQWARALLGEPRWLLLERPTRDVDENECAQFVLAVEDCRARGAAVIWLTSDARVLNNTSLNALRRARIKGDQWEYKG